MKDLTIVLVNEPGALADVFEALGGAGVNMTAACGYVSAGEGIVHVLVEDEGRTRGAIEGIGLEVREERDVVVVGPLRSQPGTAGAVVRRVADAGVNLDLAYLTEDGRFVLSGDDVMWGDFKIQGPDGWWAGPWAGVWNEDRGTAEFFVTVEGTQAYEGWAFVGTWSDPMDGQPAQVAGVIYEGSAPRMEWPS